MGEFKKILELDEVKKGAKHVYLDILEMLKWVKKGTISSTSLEAGWKN